MLGCSAVATVGGKCEARVITGGPE